MLSILTFLSIAQAASIAQQQPGAPWGLARLSHRDWYFNNDADALYTDTINSYYYDYTTEPVTVYILDTGVDVNHPEFGGRASWGANFVSSNNVDDNGHGTHLAGIITGNTVGVARQANVVAVKILDSQRTGTVEHFSQAVDWVINDTKSRSGRFIINYSAIGSISTARSDAVDRAIDAGILVVNAAGNKNDLACSYGPANLGSNTTGLFVVAALNWTNTPATFSNYGECVNIWAPGVNIKSTLPGNTYGYMVGTSNAAAFISGLAAYMWGQNSTYTLEDLDYRVRNANPNAVINNRYNTTGSVAYNYYF